MIARATRLLWAGKSLSKGPLAAAGSADDSIVLLMPFGLTGEHMLLQIPGPDEAWDSCSRSWADSPRAEAGEEAVSRGGPPVPEHLADLCIGRSWRMAASSFAAMAELHAAPMPMAGCLEQQHCACCHALPMRSPLHPWPAREASDDNNNNNKCHVMWCSTSTTPSHTTGR